MVERTELDRLVEELGPEAAAALRRNDMAAFVQSFFPLIASGRSLRWARYLDLICAHLGAVAQGRIRNLIVTLPPRHLKSISVSVMLPAFFLGHYPSAEVMCVSYGLDLAREFGEATRKVMSSPLYGELFDTRLVSARSSPQLLRTLAGGVRRATSIEGVATGVGADLQIFDDPQKPGETLSDAIRTSTNRAYETTFLSRRNDPATSRTVIVMQRLHEDDLVGHVLELGGEWTMLNLPALAEADEAIAYSTFLGEHVFSRREGEALHPGRIPRAELERIRDSIGEAAWAAQFQQQPAPAGGGLVKAEWLPPYEPHQLPERFDRTVQSWDTANTTREWSDYSVCTTWGEHNKKFYLLHVHRERLDYPNLRQRVLDLARTWSADAVVIEDHAAGTQLLQELPTLGFYKAQAYKPDRDKQMRMTNQTGVMAAGAVLIPKEAPWRADFLHELVMFPNGRYDDQVDSVSQALAVMAKRNSFEDWMEYARWMADPDRKAREEIVVLDHATVNLFQAIDGTLYHKDHADGLFRIKAEHARALHEFAGWKRVTDRAA